MDSETYRAKAAAWLRKNAAEYRQPATYTDEELVTQSKQWAQRKYDAGYSAIAYPRSAGGAGGTVEEAAIFAAEEAAYHVPTFTGIHIGFGMAMGTIRKHGTEEQLHRFGTITHNGDVTWCQMFSEPAAGSDLAALRTRAVWDGQRWILNGQKVWSSWAHHADYGVLLARHDPALPKHKGLTMFICDLRAPGVEVRPIRQINGKSEFCEIFLTDVAIDDALRIGAPGEGWAAAMTLLSIERNHAKSEPVDDGLGNPNSVISMLARARATAAGSGEREIDVGFCAQLAQFYVEEQGLKHFGGIVRETMAKTGSPPTTLPVMKIINARKLQRSNAFLMDIYGYAGLFAETHADQSEVFQRYLWGGARRISGGAEEVMKNQLAERALDMPGDIRADKDVPFEKIPH